MKKVWIPALCMLALAGMTTSCTDEVEDIAAQHEQAMSKGIKLVATLPELEMDSHTRTGMTTVEGETPQVLWQPYDQLLMLYVQNEKSFFNEYNVTNDTPARQTTFTLNQGQNPLWMESKFPVALYTRSAGYFDNNLCDYLDIRNHLLGIFHFAEINAPGSTEFQTEQTVRVNQFDPFADWLVSQEITDEMKQDCQEEIKLKFRRVNSLLRVKIVDETTGKVLNNQNIQSLCLTAESKDPLIRNFHIDAKTGEVVPFTESDELVKSQIVAKGKEIVVPSEPGGTMLVNRICKIGTNEAVYLSTLPATLKKGETISVGITMENGCQYEKTHTLTSDFVLKQGTIHTITVKMGNEERVTAPQEGAKVENATLYVNVPGALTADLVKEAATNAGADLAPDQINKWNKAQMPLVKIAGTLNAADMKTLNSTLGTYQKAFSLDMQDAQLQGGVLETGMLVNDVAYAMVNLPWNLTTLQAQSIKCEAMLTIPDGVTTIADNAIIYNHFAPSLKMLCPPSSNISNNMLKVSSDGGFFAILNEKWKGNASLDESTKSWMGQLYKDIFFQKVDKNGKIMNRPGFELENYKYANSKIIHITTPKAGQITPDVMADAFYIMNKNDEIVVHGPINGQDMGVMMQYLKLYKFEEVTLNLEQARLIGDGVEYVSETLNHTYRFDKNDVLPAGTLNALCNVWSLNFPVSLKEIGDNQITADNPIQYLFIWCSSLEKMGTNVVRRLSTLPVMDLGTNIPYKPDMNLPVTDPETAKRVNLYVGNKDWAAPENGGAPQGNVWKGMEWAEVYIY